MKTTRAIRLAARAPLVATVPVVGRISTHFTAVADKGNADHFWQRPRRRFLTTARSASHEGPAAATEARSIRPWEKPLIAEVYRQLRGQHVELRSPHASATATGALGGSPASSLPGWDYTPEDERGLRFGSAYMLLTLAWNRKFTRLRDLLVNANRAREGSKQVITRLLSVVSLYIVQAHP